MSMVSPLYWLPKTENFRAKLKFFQDQKSDDHVAWSNASTLANQQLDFVQTNALSNAALHLLDENVPWGTTIRLAILSSSTTTHLHAGIRVAGLRRGLKFMIYECDYGQYLQELMDFSSGLHKFKPTVVLFGFDARHVTSDLNAGLDGAQCESVIDSIKSRIEFCWRQASELFGCQILQQSILPVLPTVLGQAEHRLAGSRAALIESLNSWMKHAAVVGDVDLVDVNRHLLHDGLSFWYDQSLWLRAKQEIKPTASPLYGDLVARVVAARLGRSSKCLVLDLDNTIWGGAVGDTGVDGICLGQGSAEGEAFVEFQEYVLDLARRGVILAVCSKNNENIALEAFASHPEMILKRSHIASFVANWDDKATNLRAIASNLNIGLDSLVFADDSPFERELVRRELPMVAVPEMPIEPALYAQCLADSGYFESVRITDEDRVRNVLYQENAQRQTLQKSFTDMASYLSSLEMKLIWKPFNAAGLSRLVQLINKTNQFNLCTRRYTEAQVMALMDDPGHIGLELRLTDRFGDNGIIGVVIGRFDNSCDMVLDSWLMSCRVLGRQVEAATLNLIVEQAECRGIKRLIGEYYPTAKNAMVRDLYKTLGFSEKSWDESGAKYALEISQFKALPTFIEVLEG